MTVTIEEERADSPEGVALITELDGVLNPLYAPEDRHGYSVEKLLEPDVHFFVVRREGKAVGCGAVHLFEATASDVAYGEIKRMYVRPGQRGLGLGRRLLDHLIGFAKERGATVARLETGVHQAEAIGLYEKAGFHRIRPFGGYRETPVSLCYERPLQG